MKDFSHYIIKRPKNIGATLFEKIRRDIHNLVTSSPVSIDNHIFLATDDHIRFNGEGENACENFDFTRTDESGAMISIKTMALPYDILVQASLLVLKHYLGKYFEFTTDGTFEEWRKAIGYVRYHLDINIPLVFPEQASSLKVEADLADMSQHNQDKLQKELGELLGKYSKNYDICIK